MSGIYAALATVRTPEALLGTSYGRTLLVKVVLFMLLVASGAANRRVLLPRLAAGHWGPARAMSVNVRSEIVLGTLLLLAVAVLTSLTPASAALQASHNQVFVQTAEVNGVSLTLRIAPLHLGDNEFGIDVRDPRPGASAARTDVLLRLSMEDPEMGVSQIAAQPQGPAQTADPARYTVRGSYLTMGGRWQVDVILRRAGFDDVSARFAVDLAP